MTYTERLARLIYALCWIGIAMIVVWLGWSNLRNKIDPETGTAGLLVETDAATGCQYIVTPWGGIVPRTGRDGKAICGLK